jgi:hypothetical protein
MDMAENDFNKTEWKEGKFLRHFTKSLTLCARADLKRNGKKCEIQMYYGVFKCVATKIIEREDDKIEIHFNNGYVEQTKEEVRAQIKSGEKLHDHFELYKALSYGSDPIPLGSKKADLLESMVHTTHFINMLREGFDDPKYKTIIKKMVKEMIESSERYIKNPLLSGINVKKLRYQLDELLDLDKWLGKRPQPQNQKYSLKSVKIAYFCMDIRIIESNYLSILKEHTEYTSKKILQKQIAKTSDITSITENKTADRKHLKALLDAERLLNGINHQDAIKDIGHLISTFTSNMASFYE